MAVVDLRRHAVDLEQLPDVLERAVAGPIRHGQPEIGVLALGAVQSVFLVGVPPVLERVADRVAHLLVEPELGQEPIDAVGPREVEIDPRFLVGDAVGELARTERNGGARQARETVEPGPVEGEGLVVRGADDRRLREDLADRLLDARLGQVQGDDAVPVGPHHRGLEPHGVGELGADDAEQGQHEQHREEREPPVSAAGAVGGRPPPPAHPTSCRSRASHAGGFRVLRVIVTGGSAATRPASVVVKLTWTAAGNPSSVAPSQRSSQSASGRR